MKNYFPIDDTMFLMQMKIFFEIVKSNVAFFLPKQMPRAIK
jgi:hypothetical protein